MKAVLVTWGEAGFCPPQAAGPLKVECTGLLKPGTTWNLLGDQIPDGSKSGMLFKFSTKQLSDVGLDDDVRVRRHPRRPDVRDAVLRRRR